MTDKQDILNEEEIGFLLQGAEEELAKESPALDDGDQPVTMHGDLDQISLADIFQTLAMSKMEGVLRVRNPLEERQIFCHSGYVRILVPPRLTLRRLGQRLIQAGLLQPEQLRTALIEQRKEKIPLGQLLVREGIIEQEGLDDIIAMQVAEDLFSLFTWKHGTFEFFKGTPSSEVLRSQFEQCPEYEVNSLLLEVARRSDEWESILDQVGSLDEIPRQIAQPAEPDKLEETHQAVLAGVNGTYTYRQLADHTTIGLFEFSRAARDLVAGKILENVDESALIGVATELAQDSEAKRAIVLLQTLRDRPGERSLAVMRGMATVLEQVGERRFASALLLESAQRSPVAEDSLDLARAARTLVPYDPGTLSFLRTVLVAHAAPDSEELEKVTIDLLDALIDGDLVPTALEIIDDARRTGTMRPQILTREARARQKAKDVDGAITALLEMAGNYEADNDRGKAIEAYEAIVRLDRSRKDIQKTLASLRRTKLSNLIRLCTAALVTMLVGGMGFVWWQQNTFEVNSERARTEIQELINQGDRASARTQLQDWAEKLGDCETVSDLRSRVAFAEAAEKGRLAKLHRQYINERLTTAATALGRGELRSALNIYDTIEGESDLKKEVSDVATTRLHALIKDLDRASKQLQTHLPPHPSELFDRAQLTANLAQVQKTCSPALVRCYDELKAMLEAGELPTFVDEATRSKISESLVNAEINIEKCRVITRAYTIALQRNDTQRRLDPMFKAAVEKEAQHDFVGALELYRTLEAQPTGDAELRAHFRDRVTRNATITRLLTALAEGTKTGDYGTAHQHLRALRVSFPEVPFDGLVRLPLRIRSEPRNCKVIVNGAEVGTAPLLLSRVPADETSIEVICEGFAPDRTTVAGDGFENWTARLTLQPQLTAQHNSAVETAPARASGNRIFSDRGGNVTCWPEALDKPTWTFASKDLSGWLTAPLLDNKQALVASLDGQLRSLDVNSGELVWSLDELPCEVQPVLLGRTLALATTDRRLHAIDLGQRRRQSVDLPQPAYGALLAKGSTVICVGEGGLVSCWSMPSLRRLWQRQLPDLVSPRAQLSGNLAIVGDDHGQLFGVDLENGTMTWRRQLGTTSLGRPALGNGTIAVVTPETVMRLDAATGRDLKGIPAMAGNWGGEATLVGNRMIIPLRQGGLQVLDAETGEALYLLAGTAKSRVIVDQQDVFVCSPAHVLVRYGRLK